MPPSPDRIETLTREITRLRAGRNLATSQRQQVMLKITEIQLNLANQDKLLAKLDHAVNGNGKPGLVTRVDRIETITSGLTKAVWLLATAAVTAVVKWWIK